MHVLTYDLSAPGSEINHERLMIHQIDRVPFYRDLSPGPNLTHPGFMEPLLLLKLHSVLGRHKIDIVYVHHCEVLFTALADRIVN